MYRHKRPGAFRQRHPSYSEKTSEFPPVYSSSCRPKRPFFYPRRRILMNGFPNQGIRHFVRQPNLPRGFRPVGVPLGNSRYPEPQNINSFTWESMKQPEIPFACSNNSEIIKADSISYPIPAQQEENLDTNNPSEAIDRNKQSSDELWIETTAPCGRVYYYHASTRMSRWDKPDNVKIMNLDLIRMMTNGPNIRPNANVERMYTPLGQQSNLRLFPPPQIPPPGLFLFPPPNLGIHPPFQIRPTLSTNVLEISPFHVRSSDIYTDTTIEKETPYNTDTHLTFNSNESVLKSESSFQDKNQNMPTTNEANNSEEKELVTIKICENNSDDFKVINETADELIPVDESVPEYVNENKVKNSPVTKPFLNKADSQNSILCENENQNSDKENTSETIIKPVNRSRPVSSTPIPGSKWCVVWTGDDRVFFYDADRKISVWEMPDELENRADVQKLVDSPPPLIIKIKQPDMVSSSKKIKIEEECKTELKDENQTTISKNNTQAFILEAVKKREELPHDTRVQLFMQMLSEKNISAFSTIEKELHKVVFDSRYLLLPPKERKQKFENYIRKKSEEEKNARVAQALKIREKYNNLLEEADLTESTRFVEFVHRHSQDPRFKALDKLKDQRSLFKAFINNLRRKSHELDEQRKMAFLELLREQKCVDENSNWLDIKKRLRGDNRYSSISSDEERQMLFQEYIQKNLRHKSRSEKEKEDRIKASIKTREEEVQRELSVHLKELNKERENHKYEATVNSFKALLADLVRKPNISWREAKKFLKADHRWIDVSNFDEETHMQYFEEHINYLTNKKKEHFHQFLTEIPEISLSSKWKDVKWKVLKDPKSKLFSSDSKKCEREFKQCISDKLQRAKYEFNELLKETKIITHTSKNLMKRSNHLENIEKVLENDTRYLVLKCIEKERKEILLSYIDKLHRTGPPPTGSEFVNH